MNERAISFGPKGELAGVLTVPKGKLDRGLPVVLMWNVGVHHRVGPFRVHVELARRLAQEGFASLRFDASGLGDSQVRRQAVREADRERLDVQDAMDAATRRTAIERFVVVGYCSGVDTAHRLALEDPRVIAAVHIEGYSFRTPGFHRRALWKAASSVHWDRFLRRRVASLIRKVSAMPGPEAGEPVYTRNPPGHDEFRDDLVRLTRDLQKPHLFVYGSDSGVNHGEQFWEMWDHPDIDRAQADVRFFATADHTFYDVRQRRAMLHAVVEWMHERFSPKGWTMQSTRPGAAL